MSEERILVVDDEPDMVENLVRILRREGYRCSSAVEATKGLELLEAQRPDLLLTDLKMPEMDGMELLRRAHAIDPALPVIMITAFSTIESAVAAIKEGAFDYLPKTFTIDQLRVSVERALRQRRLQVENRNLREQRRIAGPTRRGGTARHEERREHDDRRRRERPHRQHVETREDHAARADHERDQEVAEGAEQDRHGDEEHHDGPVHRHHHVVGLGADLAEERDGRVRPRELPAHRAREEPAHHGPQDAEREVLLGDRLVIGGEDVRGPDAVLGVRRRVRDRRDAHDHCSLTHASYSSGGCTKR